MKTINTIKELMEMNITNEEIIKWNRIKEIEFSETLFDEMIDNIDEYTQEFAIIRFLQGMKENDIILENDKTYVAYFDTPTNENVELINVYIDNSIGNLIELFEIENSISIETMENEEYSPLFVIENK